MKSSVPMRLTARRQNDADGAPLVLHIGIAAHVADAVQSIRIATETTYVKNNLNDGQHDHGFRSDRAA